MIAPITWKAATRSPILKLASFLDIGADGVNGACHIIARIGGYVAGGWVEMVYVRLSEYEESEYEEMKGEGGGRVNE
jgi:hypothetical protein